LLAYQDNPSIWTDDFSIPESGNGIPDIIDEIVFELLYLEKLQDSDTGEVINKVGYITHDTDDYYPESDPRLRYYGPTCTSATIATASVFAHAAFIFNDIPQLQNYATELQTRSIQAYDAFSSSPEIEEACDDQTIKAGDSDISAGEQLGLQATAGVYLFALTGDTSYESDIGTGMTQSTAWNDLGWSVYDPYQGEILLQYALRPDSDPVISSAILDRYSEIVQFWSPTLWGRSQDAYLSSMPPEQYHWGSNMAIATIANANVLAQESGVIPSADQSYVNRALHHLHYIHGANAYGQAFVIDEQNEFGLGIESSVQNMYHQQFSNPNSPYASQLPPSGYLVGGVNANYSGSRQAELDDQPLLKQYIDSAEHWPVNSWEFSEPSIAYQSAYVRLLSEFVATTTPFNESDLIPEPVSDDITDIPTDDPIDELTGSDDTPLQTPDTTATEDVTTTNVDSTNNPEMLPGANPEVLGASSNNIVGALVRSGGQIVLSIVWVIAVTFCGFWVDSWIKKQSVH
jgi:hypothetical protein